ncbi:MAG: 5-oxoprolinase subunit PxpB [Hyphomicrobiales bacterium]|nr:5-oxoprolinase subunit PxpB [Hyphomicrobiales bacterium]MBV8441316.1 5-oxoprolinase subunit PxpB [Hyphomicrobiales bacterium]
MIRPALAEAAGEQCRILANGDAALVVEFGDRIDLTLNERVLALADRIAAAAIPGILETVPTFRSLMISFDPSRIAHRALQRRVLVLLADAEGRPHPGRLWRLPVCYDPDVAPDLADAARHADMPPEIFVSRHCGMIHHVYMLGFLPGQPYLGDLPAELALPRKETPRAKVAAGSVGVASHMTCVFPRATPCGLNIIGRTPATLWDHRRGEAALLAPGDRVAFEQIGFEDFRRLNELAARGEFVLAPSDAAGPMEPGP